MTFKSDLNLEIPPTELKQYIPDFFQSRTSEVKHIEKLIHSSDYEEIEKIVHSWTEFAKPYGFSRLTEIGNDLRSCANLRNPQKCYEVIEKIGEYLKVQESYLKETGFL